VAPAGSQAFAAVPELSAKLRNHLDCGVKFRHTRLAAQWVHAFFFLKLWPVIVHRSWLDPRFRVRQSLAVSTSTSFTISMMLTYCELGCIAGGIEIEFLQTPQQAICRSGKGKDRRVPMCKNRLAREAISQSNQIRRGVHIVRSIAANCAPNPIVQRSLSAGGIEQKRARAMRIKLPLRRAFPLGMNRAQMFAQPGQPGDWQRPTRASSITRCRLD